MVNASLGYFCSYSIEPFLLGVKSQNVLVVNQVSNGTCSTAVNKSFRKCMLGMIGEGFERAALFMYDNFFDKLDEEGHYCIDMLSGEAVGVSKIPDFYTYIYDTCGMASHVNTWSCIENALSEFIERQAFMLSYLSKSVPKRIKKGKKLLDLLPPQFQHVDIVNIGLHFILKNVRPYAASCSEA